MTVKNLLTKLREIRRQKRRQGLGSGLSCGQQSLLIHLTGHDGRQEAVFCPNAHCLELVSGVKPGQRHHCGSTLQKVPKENAWSLPWQATVFSHLTW